MDLLTIRGSRPQTQIRVTTRAFTPKAAACHTQWALAATPRAMSWTLHHISRIRGLHRSIGLGKEGTLRFHRSLLTIAHPRRAQHSQQLARWRSAALEEGPASTVRRVQFLQRAIRAELVLAQAGRDPDQGHHDRQAMHLLARREAEGP